MIIFLASSMWATRDCGLPRMRSWKCEKSTAKLGKKKLKNVANKILKTTAKGEEAVVGAGAVTEIETEIATEGTVAAADQAKTVVVAVIGEIGTEIETETGTEIVEEDQGVGIVEVVHLIMLGKSLAKAHQERKKRSQKAHPKNDEVHAP